jgi:gas vesicle protein
MAERTYYSQEDERQVDSSERLALAAVVFIAGIGLGTLLALMFAPQSGARTRRKLSSRARHMMKNGRGGSQMLEDLFENVKTGVERLRDAIEDRISA